MRQALITALTFTLALTVHTPPAKAAVCSNFTYQEDAQAFYASGRGGNLDRDRDGVACESLPRRGSSAPASAAPSTTRNRPGTGAFQRNGIQGTAFQGYCKVEDRVNLRSGPSTASNIIENTGDVWRSAVIHTTELRNGDLWAWSTIAFGNHHETNAWVNAAFFYDCHW
jgi:hypothetical protein